MGGPRDDVYVDFSGELAVKNRHPLPYPWNVGLYGYDGIRVERTGCIRAGRRP